MFKVKESFNNRTIGFWIGFGAGCLLFLATIVLLFVHYTGNVFNHTTPLDKARMSLVFVFFFVGAALHAGTIFTDLKFAPIIPIIFYAIGLGMYLYLAMFPIANAVTGIDFFGGKFGATVAFLALFLVGVIAAVVSCFMEQRGKSDLVETRV